MSTESDEVVKHYDAAAGDYGQRYEKSALCSAVKYPANYFRLQRLVTSFSEKNLRRVVEIGVGEGTPLATLAAAGIDVWGIDISAKMVEKAQEKAVEAGLDPQHIFEADIQDSVTYAPLLQQGQFDGLMAMGVMPHVENDAVVLENMASLVRPGGTLFIEFRNSLFSLFTFNRYTHAFIVDELLAGIDPELRAAVSEDLQSRLEMDQPPCRETMSDGSPGYDAILAKFHNPFEVEGLFHAAGFHHLQFHWYHYHPAPPFLEKQHKDTFRKSAIALEHEKSGWKGLFLCSAFIVEAQRRERR